MKIQKAIDEAYIELKNNKIKSPMLDSELLMSKVIKKDRKFIITNLDKQLELDDYNYFKELIEERVKGKPIAYIIGNKSFWNHDFFVNQNVLIPRPDTEILVEQVLKIYKTKNNLNFLEIGVGSGCILLSILKEKNNFLGTGIDLSSKCLNVCRINANNLGLKNKLKLFKSDIDNFTFGKYDLIISNPPYIKKLDLKYLDKEVISYEPKLALDGGIDGISEIRKVINRSSELIKTKGKLIIEIAFNQKKDVIKLLKEKGFYINKIAKDFANNDRSIISTKI